MLRLFIILLLDIHSMFIPIIYRYEFSRGIYIIGINTLDDFEAFLF